MKKRKKTVTQILSKFQFPNDLHGTILQSLFVTAADTATLTFCPCSGTDFIHVVDRDGDGRREGQRMDETGVIPLHGSTFGWEEKWWTGTLCDTPYA